MHMFYDFDNERKILRKIQKCQRNYDYDKFEKIHTQLKDEIVNDFYILTQKFTNKTTRRIF